MVVVAEGFRGVRGLWPTLAALLSVAVPVRAQSEASFPSSPAPSTQVAPPRQPAPSPPVSAPALVPPPPMPARAASAQPTELAADNSPTPPVREEIASANGVPADSSGEGRELLVPFATDEGLPVAVTGEQDFGASLPQRFWPNRLPYQDGDPVPSGYRVEESASSRLIVGGGTVLGVAYAASVVAAMGGSEGSGWLWVPVVGPFGGMLSQDVTCPAPAATDSVSTVTDSVNDCSKKVVSAARRVTILLVDGLVQVAGGSLLVVGLTNRHRELVRDKAVLLTPRFVRGSYGFDVWGQF